MRRLSFILARVAIATSVAASSLEAQGANASRFERIDEAELVPFWRQLGDTTLERLTRDALRANNDIRAAQASVRGARSARRLAAFDFAPTIIANTGVFRRRYSVAQLPGASAADRQQDVYDAGFDASWEVDIFGRVRSAYAAQDAIALSANEELRDVQLSLVSELARAYFELRGAQRQLAVASQNAANQRRTLQLTLDRLSAGRGTAFDRERASAQVSTTLAGMTATESRIASATYRIGVLSGSAQRIPSPPVSPAEEEEATIDSVLPALPDAPSFASVEHLIGRRPDLRGAERRLAAQGSLVNVARADYLPRLSVIGSVGYNAGGSELLGRKEASRYVIGPVISWPAFDLGRVRTRVEAARAQVDESRARFDQTVISARAEVENAIVSYDRARGACGLSARGSACERARSGVGAPASRRWRSRLPRGVRRAAHVARCTGPARAGRDRCSHSVPCTLQGAGWGVGR